VPAVEEGRVFQNVDPNEWGSYPGSSTPVSPTLALVGFVGLCLLVGAADAAIVAGPGRGWYLSLERPPGTPPDWVFAPVWTVLYVMVGVAGWLVWRRSAATRPLRLWGWQLAANALWAPAFFAMRSPPLALAVNLLLLVLILATARTFRRVRRAAALLLIPYFAWAAYATWLTAGFWWLNPT
jgi:tryptophan-rich sensory protein